MSSQNYYIYVFLDPRKPGRYTYKNLGITFLYEPFYVGKGKNNRYKNHFMPSYLKKNTHKSNKIKSIQKEGLSVITAKPLSNLENKEAYIKEFNFIQNIGCINKKTGPLTNQTVPDPERSLLTHTEETKDKIRKISKNRKHTKETREILSFKKMGIKNPMFKHGNSPIKTGLTRSQAKIGDKNPMWKYNFTEEQIQKYRDSSGKKKKVVMTNIKTGEEIEFESLASLCRELGLVNKCVRRVLTGERTHHKDFTFRYCS